MKILETKKIFIFSATLFLLLCFCIAALAETPANKNFGEIYRANVNGMTVLLQPNNSPITEVVLLLKSGSVSPDNVPGAAELMNNLVYLRLIGNRDRAGKVNVYTYPDFTLVKIEVTSEYVEEVLQEMASLLLYPLYSYDVIDALKSLYETELKSIAPIARAYQQLNTEFYGEKHPYNGDRFSSEDVTKVSGTAVYEWYRRTYQPGNAILSVSGGAILGINDVKAAFEKVSGSIRDYRSSIVPMELTETRMINKEDPNARICTMAMAYAAPRFDSPEYPIFRLLTYYLQEYQHYFDEIRLKDALVYTTLVHYNFFEKPQAPLICFITMTSTENLPKVEQRTAEIVRELCEKGLSAEEIKAVAKAFETECQSRLASQGTQATENALNYFWENSFVYEQNLCAELYKITPEAIQKAAQKYFQNYVGISLIPQELPENF